MAASKGFDVRIAKRQRQGLLSPWALSLLFLCFCCVISEGQAQTPAQQLQTFQNSPQALPGDVEPGRRRSDPAEIPDLGFEIKLQIPGGQRPPEDMADQETELNKITLEGVTIYDIAELRPYYADLEGRMITFGELYDIANNIESHYRRDGYVLTFAFIPPQDVSDGRYKIQIVEGYIDRVVVEGGTDKFRTQLENRLQPLTRVQPLHVNELEKFLLLSDDYPGMDVQGVLQPSESNTGASALVVVLDYTPHEVFAEISNRASEYAGPWSINSGFSVNSAFGMGEVLSGSVYATFEDGEVLSGSFGYKQPIGNDMKTEAGMTLYYSSTRPGRELKRWKTNSESTALTFFGNHTFARRREFALGMETGFTMQEARTDLDFFNTRLTDERNHYMYVRGVLGRKGANSGSTLLKLTYTQGLPALGSYESGAELLSRPDAEGWYQTFHLEGTHYQSLSGLLHGLSLLSSFSGQYAPTALPATAEISYGGSTIGRGYDASSIVGEDGLGLAMELRYDFAVNSAILDQLQFYSFFDVASAWDNSAGLAKKQRTLASGGAGLRLQSLKGYEAEIEYAAPLTRVPSTAGIQRERDHRVFMRLYGKY